MHAILPPPGRLRRIRRTALPVLAGASIAALAAGLYIAPATSAVTSAAPATSVEGAVRPSSFADLAERVTPTVVNISAEHERASGRPPLPQLQIPPGSPFEPFFREFFERYFEGGPTQPPKSRNTSVGSGFIVDPQGLIVTNHHVVRDADTITVTLQDGRKLEAELRGVDRNTDLALLSVRTKDALPYAEFGDSDAVRVGDWVIAVGNPFGLGGTVTAGIVSARGRDIRSGPLDDFLQIDAPINRGNSGGPLFDTAGNVVGVNTAIFTPSGGNVGIGFAIPSRQAQQVIEELATTGKVERGWMGVQIQMLSEDIAKSLGLEGTEGALVADVFEESPAEAAGIRTGDVILEFAGQPVPSSRRLPHLVAEAQSDKTVEVVVWRDGERRSLRLVVGLRPDAEALASAPPTGDGESDEAKQASIGLRLAPLTAKLKARHGLPEGLEGALVVEVDPSGAAAERGLRSGDVIVRAGSLPVASPADVSRAIDEVVESGGDILLLLVEREGERRFVAVPAA